jgi:hypothetical protein
MAVLSSRYRYSLAMRFSFASGLGFVQFKRMG